VIRRSRIHRYGVYANQAIPKNRKVIEYTGDRIGRAETRRRDRGEHTYLFALDRYWTLDGSVGGSGAEIINHSCDPNLVSRVLRGHVLYMSVRPIARGEELTVDYNFGRGVKKRCACGAKSCRGII